MTTRKSLTLNDLLSLSMSALALAVSVSSALYTVYHDKSQNAEKVALSISAKQDNYKSKLLDFGGGVSSLIVLEWAGIVANNGAVSVSLQEHRLSGVGSNLYTYTNMDLGVFSPDGTAIQFPVTLEPGHAMAFILRTGVSLPSSVTRLIATQYTAGQELLFQDIQRFVARNKSDLFGNPITFREYDPDSIIIRWNDLPGTLKQPVFFLSFYTTRGNQFDRTFSFYSQ